MRATVEGIREIGRLKDWWTEGFNFWVRFMAVLGVIWAYGFVEFRIRIGVVLGLRGRPRALLAPTGASPVGIGSTRRGGAHGGTYEHSAHRSYRPSGSGARPPTRAVVFATKDLPTGKAIASGAQHHRLRGGGRWMRAEGEV
ncbi:hypothetical protein B296_00034979 [Ensete ventricosum]|uniref:Uncharacterized protein n=1 Tax=Ensete ventricosum TaxID=4639 RepID=A0A426XG49_ENSVE|nr:hypothetical protein B296_00034979 [Ensete ventricosum]